MSLPYLVKLSIRLFRVNNSQNCELKKHTKMFCHIFYKTRPILIKFDRCFSVHSVVWLEVSESGLLQRHGKRRRIVIIEMKWLADRVTY